MKKITSMFLAALMIVLMICSAVPALAAQPELAVELTSAEGYAGDSVEIDLDIVKNDGLFGFWFLMYYDKDAIGISAEVYDENITALGAFYETTPNVAESALSGPAATAALQILKDAGVDTSTKAFKVIQYEANSFSEDVTYTGTAAKFTFDIASDAAAGDHEIGIITVDGNVINCEATDLYTVSASGKVTVKEEVTPPVTDPGIIGISIDDANVDLATDDSFDVSMYIGENDGVFGFWFLMFYEADTLRLDVAETDSAINAYGTLYDTPNDQTAEQLVGPTAPLAIQRMKDGGLDPDDYRYKVIYFESNDTENDVTYTGALAHLHFTVYTDAPLGDHNIGLIPLDGSSIVHIKKSEDVPPEPAENYLLFGLTSATGYAGDEVSVDLNIYDNSGIFSLVTMFYYDADILTLTGCTYNDEFLKYGEFTETSANLSEEELAGIFPQAALNELKAAGVITSSKNYKIIYFEGTSLTENVTYEGTAATFTFKIDENTLPGSYVIDFQCVDGFIIDIDGNNV